MKPVQNCTGFILCALIICLWLYKYAFKRLGDSFEDYLCTSDAISFVLFWKNTVLKKKDAKLREQYSNHSNHHLLFAYMSFCRLLIFLNHYFKSSEFQTVLIQIRPDVLSALVWIQTVCKGYQQTTLVDLFLYIFRRQV